MSSEKTVAVMWEDDEVHFRHDSDGFWEVESSGEWMDAEGFSSVSILLDALYASQQERDEAAACLRRTDRKLDEVLAGVKWLRGDRDEWKRKAEQAEKLLVAHGIVGGPGATT